MAWLAPPCQSATGERKDVLDCSMILESSSRPSLPVNPAEDGEKMSIPACPTREQEEENARARSKTRRWGRVPWTRSPISESCRNATTLK